MLDNKETSFKDNKLAYIKRAYQKATSRIEELFPHNIENRNFYKGIDPKLEDRNNNPNVRRTTNFYNVVQPTGASFKADIMATLASDDRMITARPNNIAAQEEDNQKAIKIAQVIKDQLDRMRFWSVTIDECLSTAITDRSPTAVKVYWRVEHQLQPKLKPPTKASALKGKISPTISWEYAYGKGAPCVDRVEVDKFLYEPGVAHIDKAEFCGNITECSESELYQLAKDLKLDLKKVKKHVDTVNAEYPEDRDRDIKKEEAAALDMAFSEADQPDKYQLIEMFCHVWNDSGECETWQNFTLNNKKLAKSTISEMKGFKYPYVTLALNPSPGSIEQISPVDLAKPFQQLLNGVRNAGIDYLSYRLFPPMKAPMNMRFDGQPSWGLGQIWYVSDPEKLLPVIDNQGPFPDLAAVGDWAEKSIRDIMNAPDVTQGIMSNQYEKAASVNIRAMGSARRSLTPKQAVGFFIVEICKKLLALNLQNSDTPELFYVEGGITFDVPALTRMSDPTSEKQDAIMLYTSMMQDPLFAAPSFGRYKRNLWEEILIRSQATRSNVNRFLPDEAEIMNEAMRQAQIQSLLLQKQDLQGQGEPNVPK